MARMTAADLRNLPLGQDILTKLFPQLGAQNWIDPESVYQGESGQISTQAAPTQAAYDSLNGYEFEWVPDGYGSSGTLQAFKDGQPVGSFEQKDQSTLQSLGELGAIAGAGFGGLGLAGLGPMAGLFGGAGGAGAAGSAIAPGGAGELAAYGASLTPAQAAASAGGLSLGGGGAAAGAGLAGGTGIVGGGLTAPVLGSGAGLGAGLGTAAGGAGSAAGGSFWAGLGKAAIGPAIGAGIQMIGANRAAGAQQSATNQANDLAKYVFDTTRADNAPALQARNSALEQMQALLKDPSTLTSQPGYTFGMNEGTKTLNNGAAARGMTYSGAQGKALQRFGQDYAGTKLDQSFNRLSALAGSGQAGAATSSNATQNYGQTVGNNLTAMGDANAAKYLIGGNALGTAVNGLSAYGQRNGWWGTPG